jgi:hypothetical protein
MVVSRIVVKKNNLKGYSEIKDNLSYWLSKSPAERVSAVEVLRRQFHGSSARLQRIVRVIQLNKKTHKKHA